MSFKAVQCRQSLATVNGEAVKYDAEGNMLVGPLAGQMQNYTFDARNRLVEAGGVQYGYDKDGVMTGPNELYQMRARYYNPEIKRFVNRDVLSDSIEDGLTMNRYAYVNGNPISHIYPFGLSADRDSWVTTELSYEPMLFLFWEP